jgi:hypothetical protein
VGSIAQFVPFQPSARAPLVVSSPTAVQAVAEVQDTADKEPSAMSGMSSNFHVFPFQASAKVRSE